MAAPAIAVERYRVEHGQGFTMPVISLTDRRAAGNRLVRFVFQRHLETVLYGRSDPKLQWHARFGNMDANAAFTPGSLPFTGAGGRLKPVQYDAARACAMRFRPAAPGWPQKATGI